MFLDSLRGGLYDSLIFFQRWYEEGGGEDGIELLHILIFNFSFEVSNGEIFWNSTGLLCIMLVLIL